MTGSITQDISVEPEVAGFLQKHGAEAEFQTVCDLARASFPELRGMEVRLVEDPDEEGRRKAIVFVHLPASHPLGLLRDQLRRFHERLVSEVPLARCPLFGLLRVFVPD